MKRFSYFWNRIFGFWVVGDFLRKIGSGSGLGNGRNKNENGNKDLTRKKYDNDEDINEINH